MQHMNDTIVMPLRKSYLSISRRLRFQSSIDMNCLTRVAKGNLQSRQVCCKSKNKTLRSLAMTTV